MKHIIFAIVTTLSLNASAHIIVGTPILKGSIKTKIVVENLKTTCKVKISKPKNLLQEDSFGNPAYLVNTEVELDGSNSERTLVINFDKKIQFTNFFTVGSTTEVRDLDYASKDGETMKIDQAGRLKQYTFTYNQKPITCSF